MAKVNNAKSLLYKDHIGPVKLIGISKHSGPESFTILKDQALDAKAAYYDNDWTSLVTPIVINKEAIVGITLSEL